MQILYLIYKILSELANSLKKGLTAIYTNSPIPRKGKISLAIIFALGIFYPFPVEAVKIKQDIELATPVYTADFDYSLDEFTGPRSHVVPARLYFTATDSEHVYAISPGITAYSPWQNNYLTASWSSKITKVKPPADFYDLSMEISQIRSDSATTAPKGNFLAARMKTNDFVNFNLVLDRYTSTATLLTAPTGPTRHISTTDLSLPFAMIQSDSKIYFFWIEDNAIKTSRTTDGNTFTATETVTAPDLNTSIGLSGCIIKSGSDEYIALAYARSATEINILTFKDGDYPATTLQTINLGTINSRKVAITQNPRTGKVILTWINGNTGYCRIYDFTPPGSYNLSAGPITIGTGHEIFYGVSGEGYNNFENTFVLPTTDDFLKSYPLRDTPVVAHDILSPAGYAVQFPFKENSKYYAGLVNYAYGDYEFYQRELQFPAEGRWNKADKTLHLQGPPWPATQVKIEYEFAEVATTSCLSRLVNTNNSLTAFNGKTGVLTSSASNLFTVKFDTDMLPASYAGYLDNSPTAKIRLLGSDSTPINLSYLAGDSTITEISFRPAIDLQFNNSYSITIASDVIDWRGNQIWEPVTLNFTTQKSSSSVLASEVKNITAYRDVGRTQLITSGSEASDSADIYLRLDSVDPAFNTVDTATVSVLLNGIQVAQTTLTQIAAASNLFDGVFTLNGPLATDSIYVFKAHPDSATSTSVVVTYPTFTPIYPAINATGVEALPTIRIKASESILAGSVSAVTVKLLLSGVPVAANRSYDDASREISLTPTASLESETAYTVSVEGLRDIYYNTQIGALSYQFTIADVKPPEVTTYSPATDELGVTIDRHVIVNFTEPLLASTVTKSTVKLTRGGVAASYSIILSGSQIRLDPDDAPDGGLRPQTTYTFAISNTVTDPSGNALPATFSRSFSTQPYNTPPTSIDTVTLYKDPLLIEGWGLFEKLPGSATVYLKVNGTDGATQTRDLATATLSFSWGAAAKKITLTETASNSTGLYTGSFNLGSLPLYGFPAPLPPTSIGSLTFSIDLDPAEAATLTVTFPALIPAETLVNNTSGQVTASNASNVRIDSPITLAFSDQLLDGGNLVSLAISSGAASIAGTRTLSADRLNVVFQPDSPLPFSSKITVNAIYAANGLKSMQGNPLHRAANFTFTTQASQTQPVSISQLNLFPDASYEPSTAYSTNDDFLSSGNMYIEIRGTDAAPNTIDYAMVSIATLGSLRLDETSANSGIYRGVYSYSNLADGFVFNVAAAINPAASQTLLLTIPDLSPLTPASGSSDVSISSNIEVRADEALDATTINSSNVKLFKGGVEVVGAVSYRISEKEIVFAPASALDFSTIYTYRISNIKDLAGNSISNNLVVSFTTQATTVTPLPPIDYLKIYADNAYSDELSDLDLVLPASQIFAEIKANDLSAATIDATMIKQSSNLSAGTVNSTLIETGLNTGIFRGTITVFNEEGAQITITSLTDPAKFLRLTTYSQPTVLGISPASGTSTIVYLNQEFTITTNKDVNPLTLSTSTIRLSDSQGIATYSLSLPNPREIKVSSELQADSLIALRITTGVKDTDGLDFPDTIAHYTSIKPEFSFFRAYSDVTLLQALDNGAEVEAGQTIYLRLDGTDGRFSQTEYATATLNSSLPVSSILLTESIAGRFTGSFVVPALASESINLIPENRIDLARTLTVLPAFTLLSFSPASGAITVPTDTWPTWNFSRQVRSSDVTAAKFSLTPVGSLIPVDGTLTVSTTGMQVRFQPNCLLPLLTQLEMAVSATVEDTNGNVLGETVKTRFTTQSPPAPPSEDIVLANFETADYATQTLAVAVNGSLFLELIARDTSFSTYETARVRVDSSDGSLDGLELVLTEIAPPSGIYHLAVPINLAPGVTITVQSQGDPTAKITITAHNRTTLQSMDPASGSTNLYLDRQIQLNFSHSIDRNTVSAGIRLLASDARPLGLNFAFADSDRSILITPDISYASATRHQLQISTNLRDSNGLFLLPNTAELTTRGESSATFDLLTGIAARSGQSVALITEATPGQLVLLATTTNMFETYDETRNLRIQTASTTNVVALSETAPGSFKADYNLPATFTGDITATLLFANQPVLTFQLAPLPALVSIYPASGSSDIAELPAISATFSRKLAFESTADALRIITDQGNIITQVSNALADSTSFSWQPLSPLPLQSTCTLQLEGLTDYLGQSFALYRHNFTTGGRQGINLYQDNNFAQLIATNQIEIPLIFVEVAASGTTGLAGQIFDLYARTGTNASTTVKLQLQPFSTESGRFRCSLELEPGKAVPQYPLSLLPGEWLELTSPQLTDDRRILYYRHSGSAAPADILGIKLFSEKHFAQQATDYIANPSLFIEVSAEDLNWFTTDTTKVRVYSDADQIGMVLDLIENGTHSSQFRNFIRLTRDNTDPVTQNLKTLPDQRVYVESVTDPAIRTSITYLPVNTIRMMAVYPSPARGSSVNFRFYLNFPAYVDLRIYDTAGHEIYSTGIRGQEGENVYEWRFPRKTANGTYFYAIRIDNESGFPDAKQRVRGKFAILR